MSIVQISKLDATRRQLEVAIRLYFHFGDPVSIHTLTAASFNVLRDINRNAGAPPTFLKDQLFDRVKPEWQSKLRRKLNEAENFFKHADRDARDILEFNPELTELILMEAIDLYQRHTGEIPHMLATFRLWWVLQNPDALMESYAAKLRAAAGATSYNPEDRSEFFQHVLPVLAGSGVS